MFTMYAFTLKVNAQLLVITSVLDVVKWNLLPTNPVARIGHRPICPASSERCCHYGNDSV